MVFKPSVTKTASDALLAKVSALSVGYQPVGKDSDVYRDLLQQILNATSARTRPNDHRLKRQTPLVNAGYAARIAAMAFVVETFVAYHSGKRSSSNSSHHNNSINVVLLGCGLDVLGIHGYRQQPSVVKVYEVDCPEICEAKRDALTAMGVLRQTTTTAKADGGLVVQGVLDLPPIGISISGIDSASELLPNYELLSADLLDIASLQNALSSLDTSCPTLVVSELVMAYLGGKGTDDIFKYCASNICTAPGSALVAYEPIGPNKGKVYRERTLVMSVTAGYKRAYRNQFLTKMQKGQAKTTEDSANVLAYEKEAALDEIFHPLGSSCSDVEERLRRAGFSASHSCFAGAIAALAAASRMHTDAIETNSTTTFQSPEPFDEHAALALHLRSYVVVCAFAKGTESELECQLCPWSRKAAIDSLLISTESGITISEIKKCDEERIRDLFSKTYEDLYGVFPAVRKMVKSAMKSDLSGKHDCTTLVSSAAGDESSIGYRYKIWGGIFLVAYQARSIVTSSTPSYETSSATCRHVVGCVGLRPCKKEEGIIRSSYRHSYEIHRLAVDKECRGEGIGRSLLAAVDSFMALNLGGNDLPFQLVATTPSILTAANQLYQSAGFTIKEEKIVGKMQMKTYAKICST